MHAFQYNEHFNINITAEVIFFYWAFHNNEQKLVFYCAYQP